MVMKLTLAAAVAVLAIAAPLAAQAQTSRDVRWYSEQVQVSGKLFLPAGASATSKLPGVVVAPGWGRTQASVEAYAKALAAKGVAALAIDYRGWGRSGGFIYLVDNVRNEDRLRFSNHTPKMVIRRGRLDPQAQIQDIRNAITYLQGEAGIDRARIGVLGVDIAGGHAVSVAGLDARVKAVEAITPIIDGKDAPPLSHVPNAADQAAMIQLARTGAVPQTDAQAKARNAVEARLGLAEYHPFWNLAGIPQTTAVGFVIAQNDEVVNNDANTGAAVKALKGANETKVIAGAKHRLTPVQTEAAAADAAAFLASHL
jgi:dienelactone hydrolase